MISTSTMIIDQSEVNLDLRQFAFRVSGQQNPDNDALRMHGEIGLGESDTQLIERYCKSAASYIYSILFKVMKFVPSNGKYTFTFYCHIDPNKTKELLHTFFVKYCEWQWSLMHLVGESDLLKRELDEVEQRLRKLAFRVERPTLNDWI